MVKSDHLLWSIANKTHITGDGATAKPATKSELNILTAKLMESFAAHAFPGAYHNEFLARSVNSVYTVKQTN